MARSALFSYWSDWQGSWSPGDHPAAGHDGGHLLFFEVNVLHNLVHLAVGAALIGGAIAGVRASKAANTTVGAVYLLVGLAGLAIIGGPLNLIALNGADNALHILSGLALLTVGVGADRN